MAAQTLVQKQVRLELERQTREIAEGVASRVPAGMGFVLVLGDFGEKGKHRVRLVDPARGGDRAAHAHAERCVKGLMRVWQTGEQVRITSEGRTVDGEVELASPNGRSLAVRFDAVVGATSE